MPRPEPRPGTDGRAAPEVNVALRRRGWKMPLPVQVFNLQVGVGGCARRAAVRSGSGSMGGARCGRGEARGSGLGARAPPASRAALGSGPRPAPASRANAFPCGCRRPGSGQDAGQPGAQLRLVVGLRSEPQSCAQQVRLAARDVGRLQPERQSLGLHAALRGTAARPACGRRPSASPEAPAPLPLRGLPAVALLTLQRGCRSILLSVAWRRLH